MSNINISNPGNKSISIEIKSVDGTISILNSKNDSIQLSADNPQFEAWNKVSVCLSDYSVICESSNSESGCIELDDNGTYDFLDNNILVLANATPEEILNYIENNSNSLKLQLSSCPVICTPTRSLFSPPVFHPEDLIGKDSIILRYNDQIYDEINEIWIDNHNHILIPMSVVNGWLDSFHLYSNFTYSGYISARILFFSELDIFRKDDDLLNSFYYSYAHDDLGNKDELDPSSFMNTEWVIEGLSSDFQLYPSEKLHRRFHFLLSDDLSGSIVDGVNLIFNGDFVIESCRKLSVEDS